MTVVTLEILLPLVLLSHLKQDGIKHKVEFLDKDPPLPPKIPLSFRGGAPLILPLSVCERQLSIHDIGKFKTVILLPLILHISSFPPLKKADLEQWTSVVLKIHITIWSVNRVIFYSTPSFSDSN